MYQDRITLTSKDILEKEFKVDTKGYRPQEVDKFLDIVIHDYEEYNNLLRESEQDKKDILDENIRLKQEIRSLKAKLDILKDTSDTPDVSSADVLRRLSNLEKIIYGEK
jgi:DivIVA domain-containing protein